MRPTQQTAISSADATASINSSAIPTEFTFAMSAQAVVGTNAAGTLKVQVSNDAPPSTGAPFSPSNWSDLSGATVTLTGSPGTFLIPKMDVCYTWVRLVFTRSGGGGALTVQVATLGA